MKSIRKILIFLYEYSVALNIIVPFYTGKVSTSDPQKFQLQSLPQGWMGEITRVCVCKERSFVHFNMPKATQ